MPVDHTLDHVDHGKLSPNWDLPAGSRQGTVRPFNEFVLSDWNRKYRGTVYENIEGSPFLVGSVDGKGELRTLKDEYFLEV